MTPSAVSAPLQTHHHDTSSSPSHHDLHSLSQLPHHNHRHDSKLSVSTIHSGNSTTSWRSHKEYIDSLHVPDEAEMEDISRAQEKKEKEVLMRHVAEQANGQGTEMSEDERRRAAIAIQRNYRGHRERRMLNGMSLDPSSRWIEAVKEARYRNLTEPRKRPNLAVEGGDGNERTESARDKWRKVGLITRRAGGDEDSDSSSSSESGSEEEREARRKKRVEEKLKRQQKAKIMDLQYFLEMVDLKHRYGSNLRTYHEEWKRSDTKENFFYWLDYGEGRYIDTAGCPRERLERERVRYLSKEERLDYLVKIDKEGRLCWAKNSARIDTTEKYKDSIHGIVPDTSDTPAYAPIDAEAVHSDSSSSVSSHRDADEEADRANKYATPEFDKSKGIKKVKHVSAATIFNKLLRGSVKKNTWIFVADTSFRLYVGIKQSGAFQHSSFLHGSRISAAGLIKVKNGRLAKLSPLSGHYRPPVSNFRAFVHSLKEAGVDMSHVSISRSYAVLVGLEAYVKTRRRGKTLVQKLIKGRDKILEPEEVKKKEELERDKSQSAAKEQRFLDAQQKAEEEERDHNKANLHLIDRLRIRPKTPKHGEGQERHTGEGGWRRSISKKSSVSGNRESETQHLDPEIQTPGPGPENAIAPEGTRS